MILKEFRMPRQIKEKSTSNEKLHIMCWTFLRFYGIYIERNGISEIYCMDTEDEQISYNIFDRINNYTRANNLYGLYILMCDKLITKESQR